MLKKSCQTALCFAALSAFSANANLLVDVELQLLTDVSGSVNASEYNLQRQGYIDAFRNDNVIDSILAGTNGSIVVQYIEWSSSSQQSNQIDWFLIDSIATAHAFSDSIAATGRAFSGSTAIGSAINYGASLFSKKFYDSVRQVMDVSGDGVRNSGISSSAARDTALAGEVDTINGIIIGSSTGLVEHYQNNIIGGTNAFHLHATNFATFSAAIKAKLKREITSSKIPEPSSVALMGLAIIGLFSTNRKRA